MSIEHSSNNYWQAKPRTANWPLFELKSQEKQSVKSGQASGEAEAADLPSFSEVLRRYAGVEVSTQAVDSKNNLPQQAETAENSDDFGFSDFIDMVNPLQHIPVVSSLYRAITGDEINSASRVVGGAFFGGPIGAMMSVAGLAAKNGSGIEQVEQSRPLTSAESDMLALSTNNRVVLHAEMSQSASIEQESSDTIIAQNDKKVDHAHEARRDQYNAFIEEMKNPEQAQRSMELAYAQYREMMSERYQEDDGFKPSLSGHNSGRGAGSLYTVR